ncbi:phosphinothricin acetyltransferase [Hypnocyclicus thermotrophus]|uniref:Phosphinothricin acetyltransferase n=1 Tax=Hypnocyclicus thermotrophus TaxID=1627895 RepID=A0AA46DWX5_9FUSO|nr:GNAT family N-acetyltransferase [Hypnocyclicus thermotrophus]TDT67017.1 phosphinothricin acetyltransferase [Hypnocyclicus thermotrophus]
MIRKVKLSDAKQIVDIYNYYIKDTIITFEKDLIDKKEMEKRIKKILEDYFWIVYEENNKILGYAYVGKWRERTAYKFTVESSIYLDKNYTGKGIGEKLYRELIKTSKNKGLKAIMGVISIPNESSIKLHEKLGFYKAGYFKEVGIKFDKWIDVAYYQLNL